MVHCVRILHTNHIRNVVSDLQAEQRFVCPSPLHPTNWRVAFCSFMGVEKYFDEPAVRISWGYLWWLLNVCFQWCFRGHCVPKRTLHPRDGAWGQWQPYQDCSRTCGGGIKTSVRMCNDPKYDQNYLLHIFTFRQLTSPFRILVFLCLSTCLT